MTSLPAAAARRAADLAALHEALDLATFAALAASSDDPDAANEAIVAASLVAAGAFPEGAPGYEAFNVVLNAIRDAMEVAR